MFNRQKSTNAFVFWILSMAKASYQGKNQENNCHWEGWGLIYIFLLGKRNNKENWGETKHLNKQIIFNRFEIITTFIKIKQQKQQNHIDFFCTRFNKENCDKRDI